jgi:hypothetical protein
MHVLAQQSFQMHFGPLNGLSQVAVAPQVPPTVTAGTSNIKVQYDLTGYPSALLRNPLLIVSHPGRVNPTTGGIFFPAYSTPLTALSGTVQVPISALQGDGIYGVGIVTDSTSSPYPVSDFAYTRVSLAGTKRPAAPQFVVPSPMPTAYAVSPHFADVPYQGSVQVSYDVSNVPNATGALLEISAGGPNAFGNLFMFNNPNGSIHDANGADTGSVYEQTVAGVKNTVTINALADGIIPSMAHEVRVIPLQGGVPVGEASDASFMTMDGVTTQDGGDLEFGFGINQNGNDGILVTSQPNGIGILSSVTSFDQTTMQPGPVIMGKASGGDYYTIPGAGILPNDTGFFMDAPASQINATNMFYRTIPGLATAALGSFGVPFAPPLSSPTTEILSSGNNSADSMTAFFEMDPFDFSDSTPAVFTYNPSTRAFGPLISVSSRLGFGDIPAAFDYDATTNKGYLTVNSFSSGIKTNVVEIDFGTQSVTSFTSPAGCAATNDFALDENTNVGAIVAGGALCAPSNTLQIVNLATNSVTGVLLPQVNLADRYQKEPDRIAVDPIHHLFLLEFLYSPDFETNNNSLSTVVVVDENGNELSAIQKFNLYGFSGLSHAFSVDPKHRRVFTVGPVSPGIGPTELEPYSY